MSTENAKITALETRVKALEMALLAKSQRIDPRVKTDRKRGFIVSIIRASGPSPGVFTPAKFCPPLNYGVSRHACAYLARRGELRLVLRGSSRGKNSVQPIYRYIETKSP